MSIKTAHRQVSPAAEAHAAAREARQKQQRIDCLATLKTLDVFDSVPDEELAHLPDLATLRAFTPGTTIFSETTPSAFLHILIHGHVRLTLHDKDGHEVLLGVLGPGDCYGEGPLFGDLFRRVESGAETICYALQFQLADLRTLLPHTPALNTALRQVYRRRLVESTLARVPLLSQLLPLERQELALLLQPKHFSRGDKIIQQGDPGDALYLIETGKVSVEQGGQTISTIDEGNFFGEISLLSDQPRNATVRALTATDVLILPAADFHYLLGQRPDIESQMRSAVEQRLASGAALRNDRERSRHMVLAINHGLLRGSHLFVCTPELCPPDCRICENACATRHGQSRIRLNGVQIGDLDILDTCRQCRVEAECVAACPEDAFEWNDHGALVVTDKCTGCGACIPACPYNAITSVPRATSRRDGPLWQLWETMQNRVRRRLYNIPLEPVQPTHRADKCDLCHGYGNMACVSTCPTGSLRLVPVEELFPL